MNGEYIVKKIIFCPKCTHSLELSDAIFDAFFQSKEIICPECKENIDLWETIKKQLDEILVSFGWHYSLLGCEGRHNNIILKPTEVYKLDLSKEIGEGELLYINYTPTNGGLFPIQMHSNTPMTHIKPKIIHLFPCPSKDGSVETVVQIFYWFAPLEVVGDLSTMLLLDAFQRFYEKNYRYMLISAQTSVEILHYKFFEKMLKSSNIAKDKIKNFLENQVTFSPQLFILLPFLAKSMNFPIWDSRITDGLRILVRNRNDVVHRGESEKQLNEDQLKQALLSAFFALKYYKIIHKIN